MRRSPIRYSAEELAFIEAGKTMRRRELHAAFVQRFARADVTFDHLKSLCSRQGWNTGRQPRWSVEADALLRELYPNTKTEEIARRVGRTLSSTYQRAKRFGLEKSETYLASPAACRLRRGDNIGATTRFPKGHAPANKGLRRPGWAPGRMKETQFRKGERRGVAVKLWQPIGTERLSKNGYRERKINDDLPLQRRWRSVHLVRWEEINGPLPKGMALKCLDGDKRNTEPSNWMLVPRALLPRLNNRHGRDYDHAPSELKPSLMAIAKLEHAASMSRKRLQPVSSTPNSLP